MALRFWGVFAAFDAAWMVHMLQTDRSELLIFLSVMTFVLSVFIVIDEFIHEYK